MPQHQMNEVAREFDETALQDEVARNEDTDQKEKTPRQRMKSQKLARMHHRMHRESSSGEGNSSVESSFSAESSGSESVSGGESSDDNESSGSGDSSGSSATPSSGSSEVSSAESGQSSGNSSESDGDHMMMMMHRDFNSSSGEKSSVSGSLSSGVSGGNSSDDDRGRNRDLAEGMMDRMVNNMAVPGAFKALKDYIAEVNMQDPDDELSGGQIPEPMHYRRGKSRMDAMMKSRGAMMNMMAGKMKDDMGGMMSMKQPMMMKSGMMKKMSGMMMKSMMGGGMMAGMMMSGMKQMQMQMMQMQMKSMMSGGMMSGGMSGPGMSGPGMSGPGMEMMKMSGMMMSGMKMSGTMMSASMMKPKPGSATKGPFVVVRSGMTCRCYTSKGAPNGEILGEFDTQSACQSFADSFCDKRVTPKPKPTSKNKPTSKMQPEMMGGGTMMEPEMMQEPQGSSRGPQQMGSTGPGGSSGPGPGGSSGPGPGGSSGPGPGGSSGPGGGGSLRAGAAVANLNASCVKQKKVIDSLRKNIEQREKINERSPALQDAKELLLILQVRYASNCQGGGNSEQVNRVAAAVAVPKEAEEAEKKPDTKSLSWWWPSPVEIIDRMFKAADLKEGQTVFDLGCGDGRIPVHAAKKWKCEGVGIDFDENLCRQAKRRATRFGVADKVEIRHGDALTVSDIERADVVSLYILDRGMRLIKPILQSRLKKGTRVVSHNYKFKDWSPTKELVATDKEGHKHWIYVYTV